MKRGTRQRKRALTGLRARSGKDAILGTLRRIWGQQLSCLSSVLRPFCSPARPTRSAHEDHCLTDTRSPTNFPRAIRGQMHSQVMALETREEMRLHECKQD
jgi:hypothetical protein